MEASSTSKVVYSSTTASPHSSHNLSALLKIKIISWSQETGLPATVQVHVGGKNFNLHKLPLSNKSGYFRRLLQQTNDIISLPPNFPGGANTFEMIALFIYGSSNFIDTFNIVSVRCAAQFLDMTSNDVHSNNNNNSNLCDRADLYLNQVVLQSWDDTLIVLQKCQSLLPWAEDLLIVSRCVESLAFMACMEVLDPERKMDHPSLSLNALVEAAGRPWSYEKVTMMVSEDHWIKDLIGLPFGFFKRVIGSLRRQGMKEKYVSPIVILYGNKWVLSRKRTRQFWECLCIGEDHINNSNNDKEDHDDTRRKTTLEILQGVVDLLPYAYGEKLGGTARGIPVGFFLSMIDRSLELGMGSTKSNTVKLQEHIVALLPCAQVDDLLIPADSVAGNSVVHLATIKSIFSKYVSINKNTTSHSYMNCSIVGELWDAYLGRLASDPTMDLQMFLDLVETVPLSYRQTHDHLYRAITVYLKAHRDLSPDAINSVCKYISCQKLSQETCIEAVLNELMPLRVVVQAVFVQQLHTQQAFRECSESFRYTNSSDLLFSGSISSSRHFNFQTQLLGSESPFQDRAETERGSSQPLSYLIEKELGMAPEEYQCTSFRIQTLEEELVALKKSLQVKTLASMGTNAMNDESRGPSFRTYGLMGGRSMSKIRRKPLGQVGTGCMAFTSQRRYGARIWRVFRRVIWFGKGKPCRRSPSSTLWPRL